MRPTEFYGIAEYTTPVDDHQKERLRLELVGYHLEEVGAILHPDSDCNPAAMQLVDEETPARLEAEFRAINHLPAEP